MERFFIEQNLSAGALKIDAPETIFKIAAVLRAKQGDKFLVFGKDAKEFLAEVQTVGKKEVDLVLIEQPQPQTEPKIKLVLYPSLIKKNRFETLIEKCTEIGVAAFQPVTSARSIVKTEDPPERWHKIATEAAQQSGRLKIPDIGQPIPLNQALKSITSGKIVLAAEGQTQNDPAKQLAGAGNELHLFIGPEGGWSPEEIELFKQYNPIILNLGARILRAETASMIFSAFCIYLGKE